MAFERITDYTTAQELLERELARQNRTVCRTTGLSPDDAWGKAQEEQRTVMRACPDPALLDLHLALDIGRRVNADHQVDFLGRSWPISATHLHRFLYKPKQLNVSPMCFSADPSAVQ